MCPNKMYNENCKANHFGNSGSKEVSKAMEIFQRSESLHSLRYTKFLGDGDSRAYKAVNEIQPYGDTGMEKLECVGYVEKWMGTRLRALKLKMKDAYPQHGLCPTNEDTWCEYNRAITTGEVYKHKNPLPSEMLNCIKNVYRNYQLLYITSLPNTYKILFREPTPLIWRAPGTRYQQKNSTERHRYGGAGWLAFGEELFLVPELTACLECAEG
ncbi:uncharacterized protein TNCV_1696811 [Trichonephila clavipes]|nr:uncharacterized protein TNCV_1696811 [Trichonephila clavipes]